MEKQEGAGRPGNTGNRAREEHRGQGSLNMCKTGVEALSGW